jgi:hypothetical protein
MFMKDLLSSVLPAAAFALAVAACGSPTPPPSTGPSFATDVQPIFAMHCVRCHGANGMLNDALNDDGTPSGIGTPSLCYLSMYADAGDCSAAGVAAGACKRGAHHCATPMGDPPANFIQLYAITLTQEQGGMPPLPRPGLSMEEKDVLRAWLENPAP